MNLVNLLRSKNIKVIIGHGAEIRFNCPFCVERGETPDTRQRLGINLAKKVGHCYNCDYASPNAVQEVADYFDLGLVDEGYFIPETTAKVPIEPLPDDFELITPTAEDEWLKTTYEYLHKRKITDHQIKRNRMGFSLAGRYAYRLILPVVYAESYLGFLGRDITGKREPRYLNSKGLRALYNLPKEKTSRFLILSEGAFKALYLEEVFHCQSAALLGHFITPEKKEQLTGFKTLLLWPDPDKVGIVGMLKVAKELRNWFEVKFPYPIPEKQADEMSPEECTAFKVRNYDEQLALEYQWQANQRQ